MNAGRNNAVGIHDSCDDTDHVRESLRDSLFGVSEGRRYAKSTTVLIPCGTRFS